MFSFLNSTVLLAAVAALIPLIIHLFSRRRVKVVEFSSLKHLKAMQRRQVRRLKIRQLLLLILRMLIILMLVLAFARPTLRSGGFGTHASVAAVIVMDNSASMNRYVSDGNLFELARHRAARILDNFGEADQVALITLDPTGGGESPTGFASAGTVKRNLENLRAGSSSANLGAGLDQAARLLREAASINKELYLITDRQRRSLPDSPVLEGTEARLIMVELPVEADDNCGVTSLDFGGRLILPGHDFELVATVRNNGSRDRDDLIASLYLDGNRVAQTDIEVKAGSQAVARFTRSVSRTGFHSGWVELSDDRFPGDNRRWFSFHIPEQFNLLVLGEGRSAELISLALAPGTEVNQYWSVKRVAPDELAGTNFREYDVVIAADAPFLAEPYFGRMRNYVASGRPLLLTYGPTSETGFFNANWAEVSGVVIDEPLPPQVSRAGYYTLAGVDTEHPIFEVFDFPEGALPEVKFYGLPKLHLRDTVRTLMRFSGDRPALIENQFGRGQVLTLTGPIDPRYSDLAGHAFFVPLITRSVEYLTTRLSRFDLDLTVGTAIRRSLPLTEAVTMPLVMTTPDSGEFRIMPETDSRSLTYQPYPVEWLGIYRVTYLGREVDRFALNLPPAEGDLETVDRDQLALAIGADKYHTLEYDDQVEASVAQLRFGRELWPWFVWMALIFMAAEMLLARSRAAREE